MALSRRRQVMQGIASKYTVTEVFHDDGTMTVTFRMDNPPKGIDPLVHSWHGRPAALCKPVDLPTKEQD
jgi:hypothetical protein